MFTIDEEDENTDGTVLSASVGGYSSNYNNNTNELADAENAEGFKGHAGSGVKRYSEAEGMDGVGYSQYLENKSMIELECSLLDQSKNLSVVSHHSRPDDQIQQTKMFS